MRGVCEGDDGHGLSERVEVQPGKFLPEVTRGVALAGPCDGEDLLQFLRHLPVSVHRAVAVDGPGGEEPGRVYDDGWGVLGESEALHADQVERVGGGSGVEGVCWEADVGDCVAEDAGSIFWFGGIGGVGGAIEGVGDHVDVLGHVADFGRHRGGEDGIPVALWRLIFIQAGHDAGTEIVLLGEEDGFIGEEDVHCCTIDRYTCVRGCDPKFLAFVDCIEAYADTEALGRLARFKQKGD